MSQRDQLIVERDTYKTERDQLIVERDTYKTERDQLVVERDTYKTERDHLITERDAYKTERDQMIGMLEKQKTWVPNGHFYSPIPSLEEIKTYDKELFGSLPNNVPGVDLNTNEQLDLLKEFEEYYKTQPFGEEPGSELKYYFNNQSYSYSDALFLHCMIRHSKPKRIIEVGSGYSSCVTLDTNRLFFNNQISCTFIEPYPDVLLSLLKDEKVKLIQEKLQDVNLDVFSELAAGDILFIDSSHVSKVNSDINYIFFKLLPVLKSGVIIHFHDVFYPFEYPREWIYEGRAWNEDYLLKSFLQYNNRFKVKIWNHYLALFHKKELEESMPLCLKNFGGSIWIEKI